MVIDHNILDFKAAYQAEVINTNELLKIAQSFSKTPAQKSRLQTIIPPQYDPWPIPERSVENTFEQFSARDEKSHRDITFVNTPAVEEVSRINSPKMIEKKIVKSSSKYGVKALKELKSDSALKRGWQDLHLMEIKQINLQKKVFVSK